jgi:uncharacterized protein YggE
MRRLPLILLFTFTALAQVPNGIVTQVSRTVSITPDEADFSVSVTTTLDTTQDQVTQAFHDAGIPNLTVTGLATGSNPFQSTRGPIMSVLFYQVAITTTPAALTSYTKKLDVMNATLPSGILSLQYGAALNASQTVMDAAHQAVLPQLLQDARTKAQALATVAGLKLGAITGVTDSTNGGGQYIIQDAFYFSNAPNSTSATFSATVKFAAQ